MGRRQRKRLLSDAEVARVFRTLGLATQEQRDKFLPRELTVEQGQPGEARYITQLSHTSEPASDEEG